MKKLKAIILGILLIVQLPYFARAEVKATVEEYIQKYKAISIQEMQKHGIPASITLAQGILESGMGTSILAVKGNNHFGIKCHIEWNGPTMKHTDDAPDECFRVYSDPIQSYIDHSQFLLTRPRYAFLFKLKTNDYIGWAHGLKKAGYATNPRYAEMLIDVINRHQLHVYDMDLSVEEMEAFRDKLKEQEKETLIALQKQNVKIGAGSTQVQIPVAKQPVLIANAGNAVFYNNKVKVVRLQKGQSLNDVSYIHNVSLKKLNTYNDLTAKQEVSEGQLIYLASKKNKAKQKKHLVLAHETLWSISQFHGVKLSKLYERNFLKPGEEPAVGATVYLNKTAPKKPAVRSAKDIKPADVIVPVVTNNDIVLPAKPAPTYSNPNPSKPAPRVVETPVAQNAQPAQAQKVMYHTVQTGDTLYNISKRYNVTVTQIKQWNQILDDTIKLGQQLIIYF